MSKDYEKMATKLIEDQVIVAQAAQRVLQKGSFPVDAIGDVGELLGYIEHIFDNYIAKEDTDAKKEGDSNKAKSDS